MSKKKSTSVTMDIGLDVRQQEQIARGLSTVIQQSASIDGGSKPTLATTTRHQATACWLDCGDQGQDAFRPV